MGRAGSTGRAATPAERKKFERALRQVWASSDALDLPRLYGVGKFPKGRLKKGNAVHAISFHLGSWGGGFLPQSGFSSRTASSSASTPL